MAEGIFSNQSVIVTGGGEGIGFEIARQLAAQGAHVLLNDVNESRAEEAAARITQAGGVCVPTGGDVADVSTVRGLVALAVERFGRLDMAVANAGLTVWGEFLNVQPEDFDRVLGVNMRGSFFLAQSAALQMREQGEGGRILLMSSVTGHQAVRAIAPYAMTKAALEMLARNLVLELSPFNITINAVVPGATVTPRNLVDDPDYEAHWSTVVPLGRPAYPADIAHAALFLLSPQAAHITGQVLVVDGGWTSYSPTPDMLGE
ncbi:MAG: glucose 1-dehydrogenase [Anaerolineae bacterium]